MARRRIVLFALVVAVAIFIAVRRPWDQPVQRHPPGQTPPNTVDGPDVDPLNPGKLVTLQCVLNGAGPCTVKVESRGAGGSVNHFTFNMSGVTKSLTQRTLGPLTIDAVTVERDGTTHRQELKVIIPAGQSREIKVNADNSVEFVTP